MTTQSRAILRAYFDGMSLKDISTMFKIDYGNTIKLVSDYLMSPTKRQKCS